MLLYQIYSGKKTTGVGEGCNHHKSKDDDQKPRASLRVPKTPPAKKHVPAVTPKTPEISPLQKMRMEYSKKKAGEIKKRVKMANGIAR